MHILTLCRLCGTFPLLKRGVSFNLSIPWCLYSWALVTTNAVVQMEWILFESYENYTAFFACMSTTQRVIRIVCPVVSLFCIARNRRLLAKYVQTLNSVDLVFRKFGANPEVPYRTKHATWSLPMFIACSSYETFRRADGDLVEFTTSMAEQTLTMVAMASAIVQFVHFVDQMLTKLKTLNGSLDTFIEFTNHNAELYYEAPRAFKIAFLYGLKCLWSLTVALIFITDFSMEFYVKKQCVALDLALADKTETLLLMSDAHYLISVSTEFLNDAYSSIYFTLISGIVCMIIVNVYKDASYISAGWYESAIEQICWTLYWLSCVGALVFPAAKASSMSSDFNTQLSQLIVDGYSSSMVATQESIAHNKLRVHVDFNYVVKFTCGFFDLDRFLIHSILGGICSFSVILVQISAQDEGRFVSSTPSSNITELSTENGTTMV